MQSDLKKIAKNTPVAYQLQRQTDIPTWMVASSSVIQSITNSNPVEFGPRGKVLHKIFTFIGTSFFALQFIRILGLSLCLSWWIKSCSFKKAESKAVNIFIGFGAGSENEMFRRFIHENPDKAVYLNQTVPTSFAKVTRPSLLTLVKNIWKESRQVITSLNSTNIFFISNYAIEWLTSISIRFSAYVFYKSWTFSLNEQVKRFVFISPDNFSWYSSNSDE